MPPVNLYSKPSSRAERDNSIPRTRQALQDNYGADVTARDDEEDAQAAECDEDDRQIKETEDARDDGDSSFQDLLDSQDWQSSYSSFSSDSSQPPFVPKTYVVTDSDDEDEEGEDPGAPLDKQETPGSTDGEGTTAPKEAPAAAALASSSATPTAGKAVEKRLPLFLPSSSPTPEPVSPVPSHRMPKEEAEAREEQPFLPTSQESAAGDGDAEQEAQSHSYESLFGPSSQASSTGESEQEEKSKKEREQPNEDVDEARSPPLAKRSQTGAVLQTLDANRAISNTAQSSAADAKEKGKDASSNANNDGCATPLARTPTQSTFDAGNGQGRGHGRGGDHTPTARSPKSQGQGNSNRKGNNSSGSPEAKPGSNKRPAEDSPSPRQSSAKALKAENQAPGADERKYKMMRKT